MSKSSPFPSPYPFLIECGNNKYKLKNKKKTIIYQILEKWIYEIKSKSVLHFLKNCSSGFTPNLWLYRALKPMTASLLSSPNSVSLFHLSLSPKPSQTKSESKLSLPFTPQPTHQPLSILQSSQPPRSHWIRCVPSKT